MKKKDKIFSVLNQNTKKLDTEIEAILDKKNFNEDIQSLILSMFYKIDNAYSDYYIVKRQMPTKNVFYQDIINVLDNYCKDIEIIKSAGKRNEKFYNVDEKKGKLECIENEDILIAGLFELIKISSNKDDLLEISYSEFLKHGNSLNYQEVLRAFNGWSWQDNIGVKSVIQLNLLYQNLLILLDNEKLQIIIKDDRPVYKTKIFLEEIYGSEITNEVIKYLLLISALIKSDKNKDFKDEFEKYVLTLREDFKKMDNTDELIIYITDKRKNITAEIGEIDKRLNNIEYLKKDFEEKNEKLPKSKKIFSVSALAEMYEKKRRELLNEMKEYSKLVEPKHYLTKKEKLKNNVNLFEKIDFTKNSKRNTEKIILDFQELFLKCIEKRIEDCKDKKEITNLIYNFRYYYYLNYKENGKIYECTDLKDNLIYTIKILIKRAEELKAIDKFSNDEQCNFEIIKNIFTNEIINLENIIIQILDYDKENDMCIVQYYDGVMQIKEINIKLHDVINKKRKMRLFI